MDGLIVHAGANRVGRADLLALPTPQATATHKPVAHSAIIQALIESLAYRHLDVVRDEYALTPDGARMFGFLELNIEESGTRFALGIRNSHDKSFALGLVVGYRVFCCDNLAFHGDFVAVSKKHSKNMDVTDVIATGVDRAQRHFEPMRKEINAWQPHELAAVTARDIIYEAFIAGSLDVPRHLARVVHQNYFEPEHEEFKARTMWSLSNAFTSAFKSLDPIPQMKAAAALPAFLAAL